MKLFTLLTAVASVLSAPAAFAYGSAHPQHDPFFNTTQCLVVKQVRRSDQVILHSNRVCAPLYRTMNLFEASQMGERTHKDRFGPSALLKAQFRFFGNSSLHHDMDSRQARVWIEEMGPTGVKYYANQTVDLIHGKPVLIKTASTVDLWMVIDQDRTPNTFDEILSNRDPKANSMSVGYTPTYHHNNWNPSAWSGMSQEERRAYLLNQK